MNYVNGKFAAGQGRSTPLPIARIIPTSGRRCRWVDTISAAFSPEAGYLNVLVSLMVISFIVQYCFEYVCTAVPLQGCQTQAAWAT